MFRTSLPPDSANARAAREFVAQALVSLDCAHLEDTVALLTSELVTNAIVHANTPIELRVDAPRPGRVRVEVEDRHPHTPSTGPAGDDEQERGRGLCIVESLATDWGIAPLDGDGAGKTVWFELT